MSPLGREESSWIDLVLTGWVNLGKIQHLSDLGSVTCKTGVITHVTGCCEAQGSWNMGWGAGGTWHTSSTWLIDIPISISF